MLINVLIALIAKAILENFEKRKIHDFGKFLNIMSEIFESCRLLKNLNIW